MQGVSHVERLRVLVFELDDHRFGVDARTVQEIVRAVQPTRLAQAPSTVIGVVNVRGELVPLFDLRVRLGLAPRPLALSDRFVIVHTRQRPLAFVAQRVEALLELSVSSSSALRERLPEMEGVAGAALLPDGVLLLCDVEQFLAESDSASLERALALVARGRAQ